MNPRLQPSKSITGESGFLWGCSDCVFAFRERPSYCEFCKMDGSKMGCIKETSLTLIGYQRLLAPTGKARGKAKRDLEPTGKARRKAKRDLERLELQQGDPLEVERQKFERLRRARSKKHGKKPGNYRYGKKLATNFAAPMIAKLRAQIEREKNSPPL